jgi:hypothetical protein
MAQMLLQRRYPDRRTPGKIYGNPSEECTLVNPEERVPICYLRNICAGAVRSQVEPAWPTYPSSEAPSERNPSELPSELDRDEEEDVDFEIPPEAGAPTKEQREEERQPPKAIYELDLSVLPET